MGYNNRGGYRRGQGRKSQKRREMAAEYSESGHTIGHLETWLRLWLCENCFEVVIFASSWFEQLVALLFFIFPLVLASQYPIYYSEFVSIAVTTNIWRRFRTNYWLEALVDTTILLALIYERYRRIDKKRIGNFEREIIALATPTIRVQIFVYTLSKIFVMNNKTIAFFALIAYGRAVQRTYSIDWKISAPSRARTILAIYLDNLARLATICVLVSTLFLLRLQNNKDTDKQDNYKFLSSSHLFFIAPAAFTEALDDWVFLDFFFLLIPVLTLAIIATHAFARNTSNTAPIFIYIAQLAYTGLLIPFFTQALHLDRKPQFELCDQANFDKRVSLMVRRMLHFDFALDQAQQFALRLWHWPLIFVSTCLAFYQDLYLPQNVAALR